MKYLILLTSIFLLSCTRSGGYHYNTCDIENKKFATDTLENFIIKLDKFNFNNLEGTDTSAFYGVFQGHSSVPEFNCNVLAFDTKISPKRIIEISDQYGPIEVAVKVCKNAECFEFNSSFDIFKGIDKNRPIVIGELIMYMEDPH